MSQAAIGKTCPYCQTEIGAHETATVCPRCETPHHADCWRENGGCTTYGCLELTVSAPTVPRVSADQRITLETLSPDAPPSFGTRIAHFFAGLILGVFGMLVFAIILGGVLSIVASDMWIFGYVLILLLGLIIAGLMMRRPRLRYYAGGVFAALLLPAWVLLIVAAFNSLFD